MCEEAAAVGDTRTRSTTFGKPAERVVACLCGARSEMQIRRLLNAPIVQRGDGRRTGQRCGTWRATTGRVWNEEDVVAEKKRISRGDDGCWQIAQGKT